MNGMNIQHSTFNTQRSKFSCVRRLVGCSMLNVECWMFLLFILSALPLRAQTNSLPPLAPPYPQMEQPFWQRHGLAIVVTVAVLIVMAGLVWWQMWRPKSPVIVAPDIQARTALTQWLGRPEDGACLSEISQILRRYVIAAFELPAQEFTTAEFYAALADNKKIGPEFAGVVAAFLRECDERKFSSVAPAAPLDAAARALKLVEQGELRLKQLQPTSN